MSHKVRGPGREKLQEGGKTPFLYMLYIKYTMYRTSSERAHQRQGLIPQSLCIVLANLSIPIWSVSRCKIFFVIL